MFECLSPRRFQDEEMKHCPKCHKPFTVTKLAVQENQPGKYYYICSHCAITIQATNLTEIDQKIQDTIRLVHKLNDGTFKDSIIRSYTKLFQCKSMTEIQDTFNEAQLLISCYAGSDVESILSLFHETKNLVLYLLLGQHICQHAKELESTRIEMNTSSLSTMEKESRDVLSPIMNQLKAQSDELQSAKEDLLLTEKSTLGFQKALEEARLNKIQCEQALSTTTTTTPTPSPPTTMVDSKITLEHDFIFAQKTLKTAEARHHIAQQVYVQVKSKYQNKEKVISKTVSSLKEQLLSLQKHLVECKMKVSTDIAYSNKMITQAKSHLAQIEIISYHVQDHAMNWIEHAFHSPTTMEELKQGMIQLIECIKYLVQDHFPTSIEELNEECQLFAGDIMDMRLRQYEFSTTTCMKCALPKLVNPEACVEFCMICPSEVVERSPFNNNNNNAMAHGQDMDQIPLYNLNTAVAERLLEKEMARRVSNGWSTEDQPFCPDCGTQGIMNPNREVVPCILCTADAKFLDNIVTHEIGILVQKGWYLHESACPECGVLFMSSTVDSPGQCIVCEKIL